METSETPLILLPTIENKDKKLGIIRKLHSHKSKLDKNVIAGCIAYRVAKPKKKEKEHKIIANRLVDIYEKHLLLVDRIINFLPIYNKLPDGAIYLMNKVPSFTDTLLLHDMLFKHPVVPSYLRIAFRVRYIRNGTSLLDIKKIPPLDTEESNSYITVTEDYFYYQNNEQEYMVVGAIDDKN